jgi:hypothetical protein
MFWFVTFQPSVASELFGLAQAPAQTLLDG